MIRLVFIGLLTLISSQLLYADTITVSKNSIIYNDVKDLKEFDHQIKLDNVKPEDTLIIFDIDDTLLESGNFVGSGKWYNWQRGRKVYDPSGKSFVIDKSQQFHCIFRHNRPISAM